MIDIMSIYNRLKELYKAISMTVYNDDVTYYVEVGNKTYHHKVDKTGTCTVEQVVKTITTAIQNK